MQINFNKNLKDYIQFLNFLFKKITVIAITIFIIISIGSYNKNDSSFLQFYSDAGSVTNYCGQFGAHLSAFLIYLFGATSSIIIFFLIYLLYLSMKHEIKFNFEKVFLISILFFCFSTLFEIYNFSFLNGKFSSGGVLGKNLSNYLSFFFDDYLKLIFVNVFLWISLILLMRFSLLKFIRFIVSKTFLIPIYQILFNIVTKILVLLKLKIKNLAFYIYNSGSTDLEIFSLENEYAEILKLQNNPINSPENSNINLSDQLFKNYDCVLDAKESLQIPNSTKKKYMPPDLTVFVPSSDSQTNFKKDIELQTKVLEEKLKRFGINGTIVSIDQGPVITLFQYQPHIDTKLSKIVSLEDDLAMALEANSVRIIAPIPGKSVVGFEISNKQRKDVLFANVVKSNVFSNFSGFLPLILGEDIAGNKVVIDLVKMPHLLIAGSTGSGKSVALNSMIISLLCKLDPDQLKLILIDPKRLEFASYNDIGHLLFPVITNSKHAIVVLRWIIKEMESRYDKMALVGIKNIFDYNKNFEKLPFIVVIIDELADLMMIGGKEVEELITRIAQMSRAAGIHMIVATQRPSVDVITGLIKVNFPSRISFKVTSKFDSRTILDCIGADKLLGKGDMLFLDPQSSNLQRVHGTYVTDNEISNIIHQIKAQRTASYINLDDTSLNPSNINNMDEDNLLMNDVLNFLKDVDEVSISLLQRKFRIGYNRSARIIEMLELEGYILPMNGSKARKVIKQ